MTGWRTSLSPALPPLPAGRSRRSGGDAVLRHALPLLAAVLAACSHSPSILGPDPSCGGYADWRTSLYVLPYRVGTSHYVIQGNCVSPQYHGWNSHQVQGPWAYAYDFTMPVGTEIVVARGGTVAYLEERYSDDDKQNGNYVFVLHDDGTYGVYWHLTQNGVLVTVGQAVAQGDLIALGGMSGNTDTPHLHFQVSPCTELSTLACRALPVTFRNTSANPIGPQRGGTYEALPYTGAELQRR